jgi:hypothetical protein
MGKIPAVLKTRSTMNHAGWLCLPHFHNAIPFHIKLQINKGKIHQYTIIGVDIIRKKRKII